MAVTREDAVRSTGSTGRQYSHPESYAVRDLESPLDPLFRSYHRIRSGRVKGPEHGMRRVKYSKLLRQFALIKVRRHYGTPHRLSLRTYSNS